MDRRDVLADAAIAVLARDGGRGLTHRAVDATAELAEGTSSYYFRTRAALLQACVDRLTARTLTEVPSATRPPADVDELVDAVVRVSLGETVVAPPLVPALVRELTLLLGEGSVRLVGGVSVEMNRDATRRRGPGRS